MLRKVLTIAGSDPSGGAGIQADLKTFSHLRVYGMAVITALTAQNTKGVSDIMDVLPDFVARQLDAVLSDMPPDAVKTGMLRTAAIIEAVATKVKEYKLTNLVVDPVMISKSGASLLIKDAVATLERTLMPLALVVTPNTDEAQSLTGIPTRSVQDMEEAARRIQAMGPRYVLIKGGHLEGDAIDILYNGRDFSYFKSSRIPTTDTHGTGCVMSSAIAAHLASGKDIVESIRLAKDLVTKAIRNGLRIGAGHGPCDPLGLEEGK